MPSKNSPLNCRSIDLEIEAIKRFRDLAPFLDPECRVFRELNGLSTVLCSDGVALALPTLTVTNTSIRSALNGT
ncbi:MAG: hypothetical protein QNJ65_11055 [Xenococcaceae cyanobacterium MO_234.B1]|nr:hypothetical protein [Xenococcaceae cyanobacterium MO_234.B1]